VVAAESAIFTTPHMVLGHEVRPSPGTASDISYAPVGDEITICVGESPVVGE